MGEGEGCLKGGGGCGQSDIKKFLSLTLIFLNSQQTFRKLCKKLNFSPKSYFAVFLFKVSAWLFNSAMCKIGLKNSSHKIR